MVPGGVSFSEKFVRELRLKWLVLKWERTSQNLKQMLLLILNSLVR